MLTAHGSLAPLVVQWGVMSSLMNYLIARTPETLYRKGAILGNQTLPITTRLFPGAISSTHAGFPREWWTMQSSIFQQFCFQYALGLRNHSHGVCSAPSLPQLWIEPLALDFLPSNQWGSAATSKTSSYLTTRTQQQLYALRAVTAVAAYLAGIGLQYSMNTCFPKSSCQSIVYDIKHSFSRG